MQSAILFPGQGAQFAGMGRDWAEAFPTARAVFDQADEILGFALSEEIWNRGDAVNRTDVAQPGILATSVAVISVLREQGLDSAATPFTAGLSLGEYTALWYAGSLDFADALRLVRLRGEAMQAASQRTPSSMTSLMGASEEVARELAAIGAEHGICSVANLNAPGQVVLSGELAALDAVEQAAPGKGIRRAVRLTVAGGFHSECMRPAAERLAAALAEVDLRAPAIPFATNVTGERVGDPEEIRRFLAQQVCSPVLWEKTLRGAFDAGLRDFLEPAPGKVLAGLLRRVAKEVGVDAACHSLETPAHLEAARP